MRRFFAIVGREWRAVYPEVVVGEGELFLLQTRNGKRNDRTAPFYKCVAPTGSRGLRGKGGPESCWWYWQKIMKS